MNKLKIVYYLNIVAMVLFALLLWERNVIFVIEGILAGSGIAIGNIIDGKRKK